MEREETMAERFDGQSIEKPKLERAGASVEYYRGGDKGGAYHGDVIFADGSHARFVKDREGRLGITAERTHERKPEIEYRHGR